MDAAEFDAFHAGTHPRLLASLLAGTDDVHRAEAALEQAYARAWASRSRLGREQPAEVWVREHAARAAGTVLPAGVAPSAAEVEAALAALGAPPAGPAELRRRGDRIALRRRALSAVTAAAVLVAGLTGLVILLPGGPGGAGPGPPEQLRLDEVKPVRERPGEVAADFDLAAGLSQDGRTGPAFGLDPFPGWQVCGRSYALGGLTSPMLAVRSDDFGMQSGRLLTVARELDLSDADRNAHGIAERYVQRFVDCPRARTGGAVVRTTVERTVVGDEGWTVVRESSDGGREIVQVVRVGSAVLVAGTRDPSGRTVTLTSARRAEAYAIDPVVQRMCVWDDAGCDS